MWYNILRRFIVAREEFVYFETVALPELVKYFKTLRAPIRPEDAVLIYMTNAVAWPTYMSLLRSGVVEPGVASAYNALEQWLQSQAPIGTEWYEEKLDTLYKQVSVIPDLLRNYIGENYSPTNIDEARELLNVVNKEILSTLDIVQTFNTPEAKELLQLRERISNLQIINSRDIIKLDDQLNELYDTTQSFFMNMYRTYSKPIIDYARCVGTLYVLENTNSELLTPWPVHVTNDDAKNIVMSMFDPKNVLHYQDKQVSDIKELVSALVNGDKLSRNKIVNLPYNLLAHPTPKGMLAYILLYQPLLENTLLGVNGKRQIRNNVINALETVLTQMYGVDADVLIEKWEPILRKLSKSDDFCNDLFDIFDEIADNIIQTDAAENVDITPEFMQAFALQTTACLSSLTQHNDIVWILPEVTQLGDQNNAIGIDKNKILSAIHDSPDILPPIVPFLGTNTTGKMTAKEFVEALLGPNDIGLGGEHGRYVKELKYELSALDRTTIANTIKDELISELNKITDKQYSEEQRLILALANVYDKYKTILQQDPGNKEAMFIMDFTMRIIHPSIYVNTFFTMYKQNSARAKPLLYNSDSVADSYLNRVALSAIKTTLAGSIGYSAQFNTTYCLQTVCTALQSASSSLAMGLFSDPSTGGNTRGLDYRMVMRRINDNREHLAIMGIDAKCNSNSTPSTGSAKSNIMQTTGFSIDIDITKWESIRSKVDDMRYKVTREVPAIMDKHPNKYIALRKLPNNIREDLVKNVLNYTTTALSAANDRLIPTQEQDPTDVGDEFVFPDDRIRTAVSLLTAYYTKRGLTEHAAYLLILNDLGDIANDLFKEHGLDIHVHPMSQQYIVINGKTKDALDTFGTLSKRERLLEGEPAQKLL